MTYKGEDGSAPPRPAAAAPPWRVSEHAAAGAVGGAVAAAGEFVAAGLAPATHGWYLLIAVLLMHLVAGGLLGVAGAGGAALAGRARRSRVARSLSTRVRVALLVALVLAAGGGAAVLVRLRGIDLAALPGELTALPLCFLGGYLAGGAALRRLPGRTVLRRVLVIAPLVVLVALVALPPRRDAGAARLLEEGFTSRWCLSLIQRAHDGDGDGYPAVLCAAECDCDDRAAGVNVGAFEVPDNGIDEDCDGADLHGAELAAFGLPAAAGPAAPAAPKRPTAAAADARPDGPGATDPPGAAPDPAADAAPPAEPDPLASPAQEAPPRYNVIFVVIDTLRGDHVGHLGYERNTTPRLDAFCRRVVCFTQARSQGSMTRESMPSMLTGRYYPEVSRIEQKWPIILDENVFLSERLQAAGYATWGITSFIYYLPRFGYGQGLETFDHDLVPSRQVYFDETSTAVTDRSLAQLDRWLAAGRRPFFALVHYGDPHARHRPHDDAPDFGPTPTDVYDQEVFHTDRQVGRFLDEVEARGLLEDSVVIIVSDHGEGLNSSRDHGHIRHGQTVYDNLVHVPLLIWAPFVTPAKVDVPVGLIDLVPTLIELLHLPGDESLRGTSLLPFLRGESPAHPPVFSQKGYPGSLEQAAMVQWPHKVLWKVRTNRWELYDLSVDPHERDDLAARRPAVLKPMAQHLRAWRSALRRPERYQRGDEAPRYGGL